MTFEKAKIALVFDWTTTAGGAERVNLFLHKIFPEAPIFTSIYNPKKVKGFENAAITTSFLQNFPFAKKKHQLYLNWMPQAYESFDLSSFDIVISSSHCCAKGIITKPETLHISYCHSPMRYAWDDWHTYFREYKMNSIIKKIGKKKIHKLRMWDKVSADRVDYFIANSTTTKKRIEKYYRRPASLLHPMIDNREFKIAKKTKGYFLAVGRLIPYKKFDLIIETFNKIGLPLKIVGTGVYENELRKMSNANIQFLGFVTEERLKELYREAEALIFPQLEDFGITPLESMSSGRPVIAYGKGGALDTIIDGKTGIHFKEQTATHLAKAVAQYIENKDKFNPREIREQAKKFDAKIFEKKLLSYLIEKWDNWQKSFA